MDDESTKRVKRVASSLKKNRQDFEPHYEVLERHFSPRRGFFSSDPASAERSRRGDMLNSTMINGTPPRALRIMKSGMQSGLTSPARPWFKLQPRDPGKRDIDAVKDYLHRAVVEMRNLASRSGLYNMLHTCYGDLGVYGTECGLIEDAGPQQLRTMQLVPGSYWLGTTQENRVDTLYREFNLTVDQVVGKFVFKGQRFGDPDWSKVSEHVKKMYDKGNVGDHVAVAQLIQPRLDREIGKMDGQNKPILSQYWEMERDGSGHSEHKRMMGDLGYNRSPISASRWDVVGYDIYGRSPAMETLPDVKELFAKRRDYMETLKRINRPTMNAHSDLANSAFSMMPGRVNFMQNPDKGLVPAFQVNPALEPIVRDIEQSKDDVWSGMYADLFMMISQLDRRQITATEIDERREEKLIALGPVLERLHYEKLTTIVEILFQKVVDSGVLGPPPQSLQGEEIEIDFVSMLAQAQKAIATGSMERLAGFVGNLSAVIPDVVDKYDADEAVDEYAEMLGVSPNVVRSEAEVAQLRQARQQMEMNMMATEQAQQMAGAAHQGAQAAKVMADADNPGGGSPGDILARVGL